MDNSFLRPRLFGAIARVFEFYLWPAYVDDVRRCKDVIDRSFGADLSTAREKAAQIGRKGAHSAEVDLGSQPQEEPLAERRTLYRSEILETVVKLGPDLAALPAIAIDQFVNEQLSRVESGTSVFSPSRRTDVIVDDLLSRRWIVWDEGFVEFRLLPRGLTLDLPEFVRGVTQQLDGVRKSRLDTDASTARVEGIIQSSDIRCSVTDGLQVHLNIRASTTAVAFEQSARVVESLRAASSARPVEDAVTSYLSRSDLAGSVVPIEEELQSRREPSL